MRERSGLNRSDQTRWLIRPSVRLQMVILLLVILSLGASILNGFPLVIRTGLALVVVAYGAFQFARAFRPRWKALAIDADELILFDATEASTTLAPGPRSFVSPLYIGVVGQTGQTKQRLSLGLFRDQLDPEAFRRLSASLRRPHS